MYQFRTSVTDLKSVLDVTDTASLQIFSKDTDMSANMVLIQNLGDTDLYLSLGDDPATAGTNGEIKLTPNEMKELPFLGDIYAIRASASTSTDNCVVIVM